MWAKIKRTSLVTGRSSGIQRPDIRMALIWEQTGTIFHSLFSSREWQSNNGIQAPKQKCSGGNTIVLTITYPFFIWVTCGRRKTPMHIFQEPCQELLPATLTAHWV